MAPRFFRRPRRPCGSGLGGPGVWALAGRPECRHGLL